MTRIALVILAGRWDRNLLLPTLPGEPRRQLPAGTVREDETVEEAACRMAKPHGVRLPPDQWVCVPAAGQAELQVLAVRVRQSALADSAMLGDRTRWVQTELALCDAWVNPGKFPPGLLALLEQARDALDSTIKA